MQHLFNISSTWYFAFGAQEKTSLCAEFCRQNDYSHYVNPKAEDVNPQALRSCIIQGSIQLFNQIQQVKPDLSVIEIGKNCINEGQAKIIAQYKKIGRYIKVPSLNYDDLRRQMYPNLIFFYGPVQQQNQAAGLTLAGLIDYKYTTAPANVNQLISGTTKCQNYIVNGFFTNPKDLCIIQKYFNFKIIHFKYSRAQLPDQGKFFDQEYNLLPHLKDKSFYIPVKGSCSPVKIMDDVGVGLCPRLIYADMAAESDRQYINKYLQETDGVILIIQEIQQINWRKKIPVADTFDTKLKRLTTIFYKDFNRKQIVISSFPNNMNQLITLENINRKIDCFIDLRPPADYQPSMQYTNPIYFLETQKIVIPNKNLPLKYQLEKKAQYWVVQGAIGSGKTTVAKHIANEFGFKLLEFDTYIAGVKQKLANPDEGEQVPLKKILAHFQNLINSDKDSVYIFDYLPYEQNDLENWIKCVGVPSVINLQVQQNQQIKRTRKKAEGDANAQINEQQTGKAKQSTEKVSKWLQKLNQIAPQAKIFKVDYNPPQILAENSLNSIMRPRIYLVQRNNNLMYQNIALKNDLGFINLRINKLRDCCNLVKNCKRRDIILCYYEQTSEKLVSDDLYWIEKNLGQIRYLGIWQPESKEAQQQELVIEKQVPPQKSKPAQGEAAEGEQKPPEDPPAEEGENANKKKFDVSDYKWTKPTTHKNLSQWFFKLKKNVEQIKNSPIDCYNNFCNVLQKLNQSSDINFYEVINQ